jgi:uncharacterized protein YjbI with pentapeptide repeats
MTRKHLLACIAAPLVSLTLAQTAMAGPINASRQIGGVCSDCDFSGQNLSDAPVSGNFPRSRFEGTRMDGARLKGNFANSVFTRANLSDSIISGANFSHADFSGAQLNGASIERVNFSHTIFNGSDAKDARFARSNLSHSSFVGWEANGAVLAYLNSQHADFSGAELKDAVFTHSNLDHSIFTRTELNGASFAGATLRHARFDGARLKDARFDGAVLKGADFSNARDLKSDVFALACGDDNTRLPRGVDAPPACGDNPGRAHLQVIEKDGRTNIIINHNAMRASMAEAQAEAHLEMAEALNEARQSMSGMERGVIAITGLDTTIQEALRAAFASMGEFQFESEDDVRIMVSPSRELTDEEKQRLKGLEGLEGLKGLEGLQGLEALQRLETLGGVEAIESITVTRPDSSRAETRHLEIRVARRASGREIEALKRAIEGTDDPQMRAAFEARLEELLRANGEAGGLLGAN